MIANTEHTFAVLAHKESPFLESCIESLMAQSAPSRIYISTSTPNWHIEGLAKRYQLELLSNPKSEGIAADWSFAYSKCETPYLTLAHQDDLYLPDYARNCLEAARKVPNNLLVFTDYAEIRGDRQIARSNLNLGIKHVIWTVVSPLGRPVWSRLIRKYSLSLGPPIPCPSVMYHKAAIGELEFNRAFRVNVDWDAWLRLSALPGAFLRVPEKLMLHRIHRDSETSRRQAENVRQSEDLEMFRRFWPEPIARALQVLYGLSYRSNRQ